MSRESLLKLLDEAQERAKYSSHPTALMVPALIAAVRGVVGRHQKQAKADYCAACREEWPCLDFRSISDALEKLGEKP